jgi:hypothetical protein
VQAAIDALTSGSPTRLADPALALSTVRTQVATQIVASWRREVAADLAGHPYTADEQHAMAQAGDRPEVPYGATVLCVAITGRLVVCLQLGDGDLVLVRPDGTVRLPIPPDADLDSTHTMSLCQLDALAHVKVAVHDVVADRLAAILLATDGYGNAQAADPWQLGVGADLARFAGAEPAAWFAEQVPQWAAICASAQGSGDDTTLALLIPPPIAARTARPAAAAPAVAATVPAPTIAATTRAKPATPPAPTIAATTRAKPATPPGAATVAGPPATTRARRSRRRWVVVAVVLLVAAAAVVGYLLLGGTG